MIGPPPRTVAPTLGLLLVAAIASAETPPVDSTAAPEEPPKEYTVFGEYVSEADSLPRIRFFDGDQVSLNDRCPVRQVKMNRKMPPLYVNGQPVGFC